MKDFEQKINSAYCELLGEKVSFWRAKCRQRSQTSSRYQHSKTNWILGFANGKEKISETDSTHLNDCGWEEGRKQEVEGDSLGDWV